MLKIFFSKQNLMLFVGILLTITSINAAKTLKINSKKSTMTIFGTTNVHDWKSNVESLSGEMSFDLPNKVHSLYVEIPVLSIKSGEKLMDKKTYNTFNATKYPKISFNLGEVKSLQITGNDINCLLSGNLTMDGVTKKITVITKGKKIEEGVYEFQGNLSLKMTDYNMTPPTALMGVMKVGNDITIKFDLTLNELIKTDLTSIEK